MKTTQHFVMYLIAISIAIATLNTYAEGGYLSFGGGYGISTASNTFGSSSNSSSEEIVKGSLGKGIQAQFTIGTELKSNVSIELGTSFLFGSGIHSEYSSTSGQNTESSDASATMIRFFPAVKINSSGEKSKLYARAGLAIGVAGNLELNNTSYDSYSAATTIRTSKYTGGIAVGFTGSIGAEFKTGTRSCFFTELLFISQSWAPSKGEMTVYSVNGKDRLAALSIADKQVEFENSINRENNFTTADPNSPSKQLKYYMPMSSAGISVGFRFSIAKAKIVAKS